MTITEQAVDANQAASALAKIETNIAGLDLKTIGTVLVKSGYFQDTREIAQAIVKVLAGRELGFGPIASMQGVYIVKGRVTLAANLVAAAIQASKRFRYRVARIDKDGCTIKFFERWSTTEPFQEIGESSFSREDAVAAGLAGGDNYKHFPRNMYFARALTNGARWYTPEIFNGPVYTPDEMGAQIDDDGRVINVPSAPPVDAATASANAARYDQVQRDFAGPEEYVARPNGQTVDRSTGEVLDDAPHVPFREQDPADETDRPTLDEDWCSKCGKQVMDQSGNPINDNQVQLLMQRFGAVLCRECRAPAAA